MLYQLWLDIWYQNNLMYTITFFITHRALVGVGIWAEYEVNQNIGQFVDSGRDANSILQGIRTSVSQCCRLVCILYLCSTYTKYHVTHTHYLNDLGCCLVHNDCMFSQEYTTCMKTCQPPGNWVSKLLMNT